MSALRSLRVAAFLCLAPPAMVACGSRVEKGGAEGGGSTSASTSTSTSASTSTSTSTSTSASTTGAGEALTAEHCEQLDSEQACQDAGCRIWVTYRSFRFEDGTCIEDAPEEGCFLADGPVGGAAALAGYFRERADGTYEVISLPWAQCLVGWEPCTESGPPEACHCGNFGPGCQI